MFQIDSKIKQLQSELQQKVQIFDGKRIDPRHDYGQQSTEIKKLVKQFDPLNDGQTNEQYRLNSSMSTSCSTKMTGTCRCSSIA
jgi:hypothetical protein